MYLKIKKFRKQLKSGGTYRSIDDFEIYDLFVFSMDYLKSALVLFDKIRSSKWGSSENIQARDLIIPARFNLNHSIELFIKSLKEVVKSEIPEGTFGSSNTHSISVLYGELLKSAIYIEENRAEDIEKVIARYKNANPTLYYGLNVKSLRELIKIFTQIVDKYIDTGDENNEQYRYPKTTKGKFIYSMFEVKMYTEDMIKEICEDIQKLTILYVLIHSFFDVNQKYSPKIII